MMDEYSRTCRKKVKHSLGSNRNRSGRNLRFSTLGMLLSLVTVIVCSCGNSSDGYEASMQAGAEMADEIADRLAEGCHTRMIQIYNDAVSYYNTDGTLEGYTFFPTYCPVNNNDKYSVQFDGSRLYIRCSNPEHGEIADGVPSW